MSLLILSHLPASDGSFYHIWKGLGVDPYRARSEGGVEGVEVMPCTEYPTSNAKTLLLLGSDALRISSGLTNPAEVMGAVWNRQEFEAIANANKVVDILYRTPNVHSVVVSLHPADAMKGSRWMLPTLYRFIQRAAAWSQREYGPGVYYEGSNYLLEYYGVLPGETETSRKVVPDYNRLRGITINLNPMEDDIEEAFAEDDGGPISIDIETPRGRQGEIILVGIAPTPNKAVVADWGNGSLRRAIERGIQGSGREIVGHNFYYDHRGFSLNQLGNISLRTRVHDTITQASTIYPPVADRKVEAGEDENGAKKKKLKVKWLGLQNCVLREFEDQAPWKRVEELKWVQAYYKIAYPQWSEWQWNKLYCAMDVIQTRRLHDKHKEMMGG